MKKIILIIVILSSIFSFIFAQSSYVPGNPIIRNYLPEEYGGFYQNWSFIQDNRGVLYVGNGSGLLEYDGKNWKMIDSDYKSVVFSLCTDKNGVIYIGGFDHFGYLTINKEGKKKYVSLLNKIPEEHKKVKIVWEIESGEDGVYFYTNGKTYRLFNNKITVIENRKTFLSSVYNQIFINDTIGLYVFRNGKPQLLPGTEKLVYDKTSMIHVLPYKENKLLLATRRNGLYLYDYDKICENGKLSNNLSEIKDTKDLLEKFPTNFDDYFKKHQIYKCSKINESAYAFGTSGGGIVVLNNEGKLVSLINSDKGLLGDRILGLYTDNQNNLWVGTNNGISKVLLSSPFTVFDKKNGLNSATLSNFSHKGYVYFGTYNSGYYLPKYHEGISKE